MAEPFRIGLTMAGAVSAGAYTAGVLDFIFEALDEWQAAKEAEAKAGIPDDQRTVPGHGVLIQVITGASAGGMVGALSLMALAGQKAAPRPKHQTYYLKDLYETWVKKPTLVAEEAGQLELLGAVDLDSPGIRSLLDSTALERLREEVLARATWSGPRAFLARDLDLILTVTNLRGVPYATSFAAGAQRAHEHVMATHGDWMHFRFEGAGITPARSEWLDKAQVSQTIRIAELGHKGEAPKGKEWALFREAVLATGAFPVALAARPLVNPRAGYGTKPWPIEPWPQPGSAWPVPFDGLFGDPKLLPDFAFAAIDGGAIDNEPFEVARWAIRDEKESRNKRGPEEADRAVLMIDPFPDSPDIGADPDTAEGGVRADLLVSAVLGRLKSGLLDQARFKPSALGLVGQTFSRFLITPDRSDSALPDDRQPEAALYPLASGLLAAFGGFLTETFRDHDFQQGRRNAQWFLRQHLVLDPANPVVAGWGGPATVDAAFRPPKPGDAAAARRRTVIPCIGTAALPIAAPVWPRLDPAQLERVVAGIGRRADAIVARALKGGVTNRWVRAFLGRVWATGARGLMLRRIRWIIESELIRRDQHGRKDGRGNLVYGGLGLVQRKVLAALVDPAFELRTVPGIARREKLDPAAVEKALVELAPFVFQGPRVAGWWTYGFIDRRPGWPYRFNATLPIVEAVWSEVAIDIPRKRP